MTPLGYDQTPGPHRTDTPDEVLPPAPAPPGRRYHLTTTTQAKIAPTTRMYDDIEDALVVVRQELEQGCILTIVPVPQEA